MQRILIYIIFGIVLMFAIPACAPRYVVQGFISNSNNNAVENARIVIMPDDGSDSIAVLSGNDGFFYAQDLKKKSIRIKIIKPNYTIISNHFELDGDKNLRFSLKRSPTTVSGRVLRSEDSQPLQGVVVSMPGKVLATSDLTGKFYFDLPPEDNVITLKFTKDNYIPDDLVVDAKKYKNTKIGDVWLSLIQGVTVHTADSLEKLTGVDVEVTKDVNNVPDSNFLDKLCAKSPFDYQMFAELFRQANLAATDSVIKKNLTEYIKKNKISGPDLNGEYSCLGK